MLTDPRAMRALGDPSRLGLHDRLRRRGPATIDELAAFVVAERQTIEEQLEELEAAGLVERHPRGSSTERAEWAVVGKGFVFEIPEDAEGQAAARQLSNTMFLSYVDAPRRWVAEDEPHLALDWVRASGLLNARVLVTPSELRHIQGMLEELLEPFLTRKPEATPADARHARILSYFMPEADDAERRA